MFTAEEEIKRKAVKTSAEPPIYRIETCVFQRTTKSPMEKGLLLNEGKLGIIDSHGKFVKTLWSWHKIGIIVLITEWFSKDDSD